MIFKKQDYPDTWPFADGSEVEVAKLKMSLVAHIMGVDYAMNGMAVRIYKLPEVRILEGKSVGPFIKEMLR
jgi:hypothetical protein